MLTTVCRTLLSNPRDFFSSKDEEEEDAACCGDEHV
jgi:hypothetical protein